MTGERTITKEIYERSLDKGGILASQDMSDVFDLRELCGYGVYSTRTFINDKGEYKVRYRMGDSCD